MAFTFRSTAPPTTIHELEVNEDGSSSVVGDPSGIQFDEGCDVTVISWGLVPFTSMKDMFFSGKITIEDKNSPLFAPGCSLSFMFNGCEIIGRIGHWDTVNVTDMSGTFHASDVNQPLHWNTTSVTTMYLMFCDCEVFDQPLRFDTSSVTDMGFMFARCRNLNQSFLFNTSKVTNMSMMFSECLEFNKLLHWDTLNVINMWNMFSHCVKLERAPMFDMSGVGSQREMFSGCRALN